jgi:hypothetical protein
MYVEGNSPFLRPSAHERDRRKPAPGEKITGMGKDIWNFILAAGYIGGGSVILAVVLLIVSMIEHQRERNLSAQMFFLIACFAFCFGAYMAWHKQYEKTLRVQTTLDQMNNPVLHASIGQIFVAPAGDHNQNAIVTVMVTVTNTGTPSIAQNWHSTIKLPGKNVELIDIPPPLNTVTLSFENASPIMLLGSDYVPRKSMMQPIPTGGAAGGFMQYLVIGETWETISSPAASLRLDFTDINGKPYFTERIIGKESSMLDTSHLQNKAKRVPKPQ